MRFSSPIRLVLFMSAVILLIFTGVYLALSVAGVTIFNWKFLIWFAVVTSLFLFFFPKICDTKLSD